MNWPLILAFAWELFGLLAMLGITCLGVFVIAGILLS